MFRKIGMCWTWKGQFTWIRRSRGQVVVHDRWSVSNYLFYAFDAVVGRFFSRWNRFERGEHVEKNRVSIYVFVLDGHRQPMHVWLYLSNLSNRWKDKSDEMNAWRLMLSLHRWQANNIIATSISIIRISFVCDISLSHWTDRDDRIFQYCVFLFSDRKGYRLGRSPISLFICSSQSDFNMRWINESLALDNGKSLT